MSSSDRAVRPSALARLTLLALVALALPACTVSPLYGTARVDDLAAAPVETDLAALRGQISVAPANDRTAQIFRNALLFRLNGGKAPATPRYEIRYGVTGLETVVSVQQGSGIPSASLYRMNATYEVVRLADAKVIASGMRFATAPFDRSSQLYASSRAVVDARERAGTAVAERVELAVLAAIRKDIRA